ncbi:ATP-grasp domain-containing protein [Streptomyces albireticuli]|uniref:ATP-grasp domain-containing protein n=1 Tax=Streptomyces albireticuli TaxID=1940 RepID=UPI0036806B41
MKRIAFLRSIEVQQTAPYLYGLRDGLDTAGIEARLFYTDGACGPEDFPGTAEKLSPDVSCEELVARLVAWAPDGVVSLSIADENALRDALVKEGLAAHGIPMVMHGVEITRTLANKWDTKELVRAHGLDTPEGILLDGDLLNGRSLAVPAYPELVERSAELFGYPLLTKPLWDCLANGVAFLDGSADLQEYLNRPYDGNAVLEKCLRGELCSVEIVGRDGDFLIQPLIWKGETGGKPEFTFGALRYSAPRPAAEADFAPVAARLRSMCAGIGVEGAVEVEMIYHAGTYQVIEINPRVSGSTTLSIASSGRNTYGCLVDLVRGDWSARRTQAPAGERERLAFQFPVEGLTDALARALEEELDLVRATRLHIDGQEHGNVIITCEFADAPALGARLHSLRERFGMMPAALVDEIAAVAWPAPVAAALPLAS